MRDLQTHLELMDAFLGRAAASPVLRPVVATALRSHIHEITALKLKTGFSPELHDADVALTKSISRFQFSHSDRALANLCEHLSAYHAAALAPTHSHSAIEPMVELTR